MGHGDSLGVQQEARLFVDRQALRRSFSELRVPGFVFGVAELLEVAAVAFGFAGDADLAAVVD
jgi:hypothetical protein